MVVSRGDLGQKHTSEGAARMKAYRRKSQEARQLEQREQREGSGRGRGGTGAEVT